jgi:DUF1680 family protein
VEAHAVHTRSVYFESAEGLIVSQYIPSELNWRYDDHAVRISQSIDWQLGQTRRPRSLRIDLTVASERPSEWTLTLRLPWWLCGEAEIEVNGQRQQGSFAPSSYHGIRRTWRDDRVSITLPKGLTGVPMADDPSVVAFMDGPVVLAGLCDDEMALYGDKDDPQTMLTPHNEREWSNWMTGYRTRNQPRNVRLVPLYEVADERYSVYFPVRPTP